ncbi:uncharacterized protein LTR77_001354 [Saxophila tyrrhenica]|uniref:Prenylcysteine lyase domain-containing protein n=1 Tax=Saxophila tyrrhenica TaxID=1690608 RepID=A0AAV9PPR4_9PEZI|nr:hypothetical protein LTR77_001354 [Saxophila tyrrhenica]
MATYTSLLLLLVAQQVRAFVVPSLEQLAILADIEPSTREQEPILGQTGNTPKKIAIIGSGITGASAASRLYEGFRFSAPADQQPSITVFERNPIIGGRITQAYAYDSMIYPIDTCAATFDSEDLCIVSSAVVAGLTLQARITTRPRTGEGIWDGDEMLAVEEEFRDAIAWSEFRQRKWSQRYDRSPTSFSPLVNTIRGSLGLVLGTALPILGGGASIGVANLSAEVEIAGLSEMAKSFQCSETNYEDLDGMFDSPEAKRFGRELVNAGTRERYFANGDELNVLEYILGFQDQLPSYVSEGNLRLVERLLKLSTPDVRLGAEVQKIETKGKNDHRLTIVPTDGGVPATEQFDAVILATPYSLANITFDPPLQNATDLIQHYEDSFVTHFTTPSRLNQTFFNWTDTMPQNILTTTSSSNTTASPFFSLTLLKQYARGSPPTAENLYKIVSREEIAFTDIQQYLEAPANITWIDVQPLPRSVPVKTGKCRRLVENLEVAPGVFYAGAGEQVIASADIGCRLGVNAASLLLGKAR